MSQKMRTFVVNAYVNVTMRGDEFDAVRLVERHLDNHPDVAVESVECVDSPDGDDEEEEADDE